MAVATEGEKRFAEARVKLIRTAGDFSDEHYVDSSGVRKPRLALNWKPDLIGGDIGNHFTVTGTGAGAVTHVDRIGGWAQVVTGSSDNDEAYVASTSQCALFDTIHESYYRIRLDHTVATGAGNSALAFGVSDTQGANLIADAGNALATSYDGALFAKLEDGAYWTCNSSNAGTQVQDTLATETGKWANGDEHLLEILYHPNDGTTGKIFFLVEGVCEARQDITISGLQEMNVVFGVKAHEAVAQTLFFNDIEAIAWTARPEAA